MAVTSVVTVVLPFVPVMATTGDRRLAAAIRAASSISACTGTPAAAAAANSGWPTGTPGLGHHQITALQASQAGPVPVGVGSTATPIAAAASAASGGHAIVEHHHLVPVGQQGPGHGPAGRAEADDGDATAAHPVPPLDRKSA